LNIILSVLPLVGFVMGYPRARRSRARFLLLAASLVLALRGTSLCYITVFGGTGLTGREVVYQALQRGEEVRVLARDPAKLLTPLGSAGTKGGEVLAHPNLSVVEGDVRNSEDVLKVIDADVTGVVVALGGKTADVGETMLTDGTSNIIAAMKQVGAKRVAVLSSIGVGDSQHQAPLFFRILMRTMMRKIFKDKNNQEELFTSDSGPGGDLEYVIVRPGGLTVEKPTGVINVIEGQAGSIARADVATFCLGAVLEPDFAYLGKTPCISSLGGTAWVKDRSDRARMGESAPP